MPKLSVIIPAYNVEKYIDQAVKSVIHQSEKDLEVIVINDGSLDQTSEIVRSLKSFDNRVRLFDQTNSGKPSIVRNRGILLAKGEIICFLDGDDIFFEGKINKITEVFKTHPDVSVVFHDVKRINPEGEMFNGSFLQENKFIENAFLYMTSAGETCYLCDNRFYNYASSYFCPLHTSAVAVTAKRLMEEPTWFPEDMLAGEDLDLWFRLLKNTKVAFIDECLSGYRTRPNSITQDREEWFLGTIRAHTINLNRTADLLTLAEKKRIRRRIARRYQHLGYYYFNKGQVQKARESYVNSFRFESDFSAIRKYMKTFIPNKIVKYVKNSRNQTIQK